jgi:hypothetical protein
VEYTDVVSVRVFPLQTVVGPGGVISGCGKGFMVAFTEIGALVQPFTVVVME